MEKNYLHSLVFKLHQEHPQSVHFLVCCASAFVGETLTYPLDIIKTRLQVVGQLSPSRTRPSLLKLTVSIVKNEGFLSFWQGLSPALYRHFLYTGARMPIYEVIRGHVFLMPPASSGARKAWLEEMKKSEQVSDDNPDCERLSPRYLWRAAAAGILSGALAQFICSPTDLLKVRLQTERRRTMTVLPPPPNAAIPHASAKAPPVKVSLTMRELVREAGFFGLWRGGLPNVQRAALVNMGEMTTYDTAKRWLQLRFGLKDGPLLHGCASTMSGFVSAILGTPADMIKTRMMNQRLMSASGTALPPLYSGMIDCAVKVVRQEGFFTLYRGFFLIWARMAPWSLTFWLTYEKLREYTGAGGF
ncbi:hypothetical protein AAHC03_05149 [Spirometra sp. Aus1]|nr:unnamed protein product [Spirometra erinaceieuropaei]